MQPELLAEQDTVPTSLLLSFVSLLLVNIKEKHQDLLSFHELAHLKRQGTVSLWPRKSEPDVPFSLCSLQGSQEHATDAKRALPSEFYGSCGFSFLVK